MFLLSLALELWLQYTCLNSNVRWWDAVNSNTCYPHFHVYIWTKFNIIWYCSFSFTSPVDMGWDVISSQWHTEAALLYNIGRPFNLHTNHFGFYQIIEVRLMTTDISPGHWVLVSLNMLEQMYMYVSFWCTGYIWTVHFSLCEQLIFSPEKWKLNIKWNTA